MDIISYSLSKKIAASAVSGVKSMSVDGQTLTINTKDSGVLTMTFPKPRDGISVTDIDVNANNQIVFTMSDGSEIISGKIPTVKGDKGDPFKYSDFTTEQLESLKGEPGVSPTITENADNTDKIYKLDVTTADGTFTTPNLKGADGQGGSGGSGEENVIESIKVNGVAQTVAADKSVDITVPSIEGLTKDADLATVAKSGDYEDLSNKPAIPSLDGYAKTSEIPTKVSQLENDSNYLSSIPEEYVTETELEAKGYLTEHQDISGKVDKVEGKSLISDTEIARLASVDNYNDTQVKTQIQAVANGLMDSVGYSADYKTIDIIAKNGVKKSVNVAPIISHASITELSDVDTTNKATGKALVYNATTSKHEYADVSGTDEKVKMDSSTDAKYLGELLDNVTIANENGKLKVKKLDGQEVTITEINYLKGLTMNVMDLVNMFSNGGVKIINTPVATYAELLTLDKSSFIEGISYLVYVLADENHDNAKTTYLVDKDSETPTYFGFADSQRDFTTNPIDLATEITGKLGIANMDSDAIKALFTVDDTYKTETATNNAFSTHGAKALYDELLLAIGNKANSSDLTAHKDDTDIHVSTEDRTKWDSAKTHADSAHAPSNAQENVLETVKVNGTALEVSDKAVNVTVPTTVAELTDSADYAKTADVNDSISTLQTDKADASDLTAHTDNADIHVTADDKTLWNTVEDKVDKTDIATALDDTATDEQVTSALLAKTELDKKIGKTNIATELSDSSTDDEVVGALTAYNELQKLESATKEQFATASGDSITVNDSVDGNIVELGIKGNSFQQTYSGKNLFNATLETTTLNGVTCTNNGDGTYTLNGTASSDVYFNLGNVNIIPGNKYRLCCTKSDTAIKAYMEKGLSGYEYNTLTATSSIANVTVSIKSGVILSNVRIKPMLVDATLYPDATYDDFEPYVGGIPSPNPEYPQEIKSVVNPVVKVCGKNIINGKHEIHGTHNAISFEIDKVVIKDNTETYGGTFAQHTLKKGTYTISCECNYIDRIEIEIDRIAKPVVNKASNSYTFTIDKDSSAKFIVVVYANVTDGVDYIQLEKGSVATPYEPYHEQTVTLPYTLNAIPVSSGGNVMIDGQQYIADYVDFENKKLVRRVKKKDLGEFDWNYVYNVNPKLKYFDTTILDSFKPTASHPIVEGFCDSYSVEKNNIPQSDLANNKVAIGWLNLSSTRCCLEIRDDNYTNALDFKNAVKGRYIYYPLAIQETIDLTDEEVQAFHNLATYYPTTNVFVSSDQLNGYAECKYPTTDVSGLASRNESRIAELAKDTDDSLSVIGKCKNLLNPTLQTTTLNGVTCTNNGDGTYTINGTSTKDTWISFGFITLNPGKYKFIATDNNVEVSNLCVSLNNTSIATPGSIFTIQSKCACTIGFSTYNNTFNNVLIKPMLTTNLNATYDDFVPYTGDGETLTHDVAKLNSNLVRVDKNTIANLCNSKNGNNILIGQIKANTIYTLFFEQDSETGFNLKLNISDGVNVSYKEISPTYSKTKVICWFSNTYDGNIFFNGWKGVNQRNFMIAEGKFDEWIDYITPTGNSGRLNVDVANLKNDVGSTDISAIGDGTVTGAISAVNDKLGGLTFSASGTTLSITDGTNTWTLEANS